MGKFSCACLDRPLRRNFNVTEIVLACFGQGDQIGNFTKCAQKDILFTKYCARNIHSFLHIFVYPVLK